MTLSSGSAPKGSRHLPAEPSAPMPQLVGGGEWGAGTGEGTERQPSRRHSLSPRPSGVGTWRSGSEREVQPPGPVPGPGESGLGGRVRPEEKAFSSQTSQVPISCSSGPGWRRAVFSDWTADEGARVHETQHRAEGVIPPSPPTAGPGTAQKQGSRDSEGGKNPAWPGGLPQGWLLALIRKASGGLAPNPLPMSLSSRKSQGTTVVVFH